jgi:micrococcal nuclease
MRSKATWPSLLGLLLIIPGLSLAEAPPSIAGPWTGTVSRVVDGDTIVVDVAGLWETVRIIGIDTPEIVDPRKPVEAFAKEASDYTKRTLSGKTVKLVADPGNTRIGHRDRYGRLLAYVWVGESFFNETIIRDGYAHAYVKYPFRQDYMELFRAAEKEAREASRGLWGPPKEDGGTSK